jgi:hypothetical protein
MATIVPHCLSRFATPFRGVFKINGYCQWRAITRDIIFVACNYLVIIDLHMSYEEESKNVRQVLVVILTYR